MGYIGDGRLFALTNGANLQYLCGYDGTSFLSLQTGLSLYSRHENGLMVHNNHALSHFDGKMEITDLSFDGCFVRHSETTRSLTYRLQFPPYCHLYEYPPLKVGGQGLPLLLIVIPAGVPKPEGGATQNERRLLMTVLGDATLSSDKQQLCLCPGRSTLLFALGTKGNELSALKRRLAELDNPVLSQSRLYRLAASRNEITHPLSLQGKSVWDCLQALTCHAGGVLSGHGELTCLLADQAVAGEAFLHLGKEKHAVALADFLLSRLDALHYLPLAMSAESLAAVTEPTDREHVHYPSISRFFLSLASLCHDPDRKKRYENAAKALFAKIEEKAGKEGLGFSGTELVFRRGAMPPDRLLYGNAEADCTYRYLKSRLQKESPQTDGQAVDRFSRLSIPTIDDPIRLGKLRLPDVVYGPCASCRADARYVGWLKHAKYGTYLCPSCYAKGQRETVSQGQEIILPGSYALCCHLLWQARHMEHSHLCRITDHCLDRLEKAPDSVAFYETARLAAVLEAIGSPDAQTLRERLDAMLLQKSFPLCAAECAAYLLAQPGR